MRMYWIIIRNILAQKKGIIPLLIIPLLFSFTIQSNNKDARSSPIDEFNKSIKIGFLITADTSENALTKQAVNTLQLVLDQVNASGGIGGQKIKAIIKSVDGNWGTGSKKAVSLINEDEVSALLGFVDGQSAHLIEQVCAKAEIPFVSTFSPDPTLSKINIPWFFSSIPNADQQSKALVNEIYVTQEKRNITIVASDDYDRSYLARSFLQIAESKQYSPPPVLTYRSGNTDFKKIVSKITGTETEGIVFFGSSDEWESLFSLLNLKDLNVPMFLPVMELDKGLISRSTLPVFTIVPEHRNSEKNKDFRSAFNKKYGYAPGVYANYVYNGLVALLEAIKLNGDGRTPIREGLLEIDFNGINGPVSFDSSGLIEGNLKIIQMNRSLSAE